MDNIINFFNHPFFNIIGGISTILMIVGFICSVFLVIKGVLPIWYKLGKGISKRRIALFASSEYETLKNMMVDSKIFKKENIIQITNDHLKNAEKSDLFLVHWKDFQNEINDILSIKKDQTALIIYAPQAEGCIENQEILNRINNERNAIIVNFRGRLLNDMFTLLITTGYQQ